MNGPWQQTLSFGVQIEISGFYQGHGKEAHKSWMLEVQKMPWDDALKAVSNGFKAVFWVDLATRIRAEEYHVEVLPFYKVFEKKRKLHHSNSRCSKRNFLCHQGPLAVSCGYSQKTNNYFPGLMAENLVMSQVDIASLKETLCAQQQLLQKLYNELDEEREASSSAASEALSMILRLQGEKAAVKMEAEQYKRLAEEKMCHAEESLAIFEHLFYQKEMEIAALDYRVIADLNEKFTI